MHKQKLYTTLLSTFAVLSLLSACGTDTSSSSKPEETEAVTTTQTQEVQTEKEDKTISESEAKEIAKNAVLEAYKDCDCVIGSVGFQTTDNGKPHTRPALGRWLISVKGNCKIPDDYGHIHTIDFEAEIDVDEITGEIVRFDVEAK